MLAIKSCRIGKVWSLMLHVEISDCYKCITKAFDFNLARRISIVVEENTAAVDEVFAHQTCHDKDQIALLWACDTTKVFEY